MAQAENTPKPEHQPIAYVWVHDPDHWCFGEYVPLHGPLTLQMSRFTEAILGDTLLRLLASGVDHAKIYDMVIKNRPGKFLRGDA